MCDKFGVRDKRWYVFLPAAATVIALMSVVYVWSTFHYLMAARTIREDLANSPN